MTDDANDKAFNLGTDAYKSLIDVLVLAETTLSEVELTSFYSGILSSAMITMAVQLGATRTKQIVEVMTQEIFEQAIARELAAELARQVIQTAQKGQ